MAFRVPKQLDIVWMEACPKAGREAGGHNRQNPYRPYLVLSKREYNVSGMIEAMPMSSHNHMLPPYRDFMVPAKIDSGTIHGKPIHGYVFAFQLGCYDYLIRKGADGGIIGHMNHSVFRKVIYFVKHMFK